MDISGPMDPPSDTEEGAFFPDQPASSGEPSSSTMHQDSSTFEAATNPGLGLDNGSWQARAPLAGLRTESASNRMFTDPQVLPLRPKNANFNADGPVVTGSTGPPPVNNPPWQGNNAAAVQVNATPFGTNPQTPAPYPPNSQPQNIPSAAGMPVSFGETGVIINIQNGHNYHVGAGAGAITEFVSQGVDMGLNTVGGGGGVAGTFPPNGGPVAGTEMGMQPSTSGRGMNTPANHYSVGAVNTFASGGGFTNSRLPGSGIPSGTGDSTRHHYSYNRGDGSSRTGTLTVPTLPPEIQRRLVAAELAYMELHGHIVPSGPVRPSNRNTGGSLIGQNTSARFNEAYYTIVLSLRLRATTISAETRPPNGNLGPGYNPQNFRAGPSGPPQAGTLPGNFQATSTGTRVQVNGTGRPLPNGAGVLSNGTSMVPSNTDGQGQSAVPPAPSGNALPIVMNGFSAMVMGPQNDLTGLNFDNGMPAAQFPHASLPSGISVGNTGTMPQGTDQSQSNGLEFLQFPPRDTHGAEQSA